MITAADFKVRFPEYAATDDARVDLFIADAVFFMGPDTNSKWLNKYDYAQSYLVAHLLTLANLSATGDSGAPAPIKKQDVDGVLIESAIVPVEPTLDEYYSTTYGKRYVLIRRTCFNGIIGV